MQTNLSPEFKGTADGDEAEAILRKCVHCGFCTATCPTYQLLGDELDGPRGRIYLIKQMLEGEAPTEKTQMHLDRCLTCRNCESTCPSGVEYGHLVDIGRRIVEEKVPRTSSSKLMRWTLKEGLTSSAFAPAMALGKLMRPLLPSMLKDKVPASQPSGAWPTRTHARKVLMLAGCVQPSMMPNVNTATARVLDACGIQTLVASNAGCCGGVKFHLNDQPGGLAHMRANVDAWWPYVERGEVEAIVMNASGCGVTVKEYGHHLRHDAAYADKAARISELTRDLSELLPDLVASLAGKVNVPKAPLAYHPPCTLQHGQKLRGGVEHGLSQLGFDVRIAMNESHLCCGSAGTYSVLEPVISHQLRDRKLSHLSELKPAAIISANVGCITHLQSGTATPVRHWIEVLDDALAASSAGS
ncbi:glycolate oxidase subunit GlcF [Caenimonas koreensis DSM 17982]|uniref:Glycolate oxidase iron-sulfur subunit n=1 Tax=Caenimonas koreensis DSM 17982 TaxID=1121255 RepID=A0A844B893_9BURK|nr:glycolate oxidase subunit GlcF [Caenimonas koreensis]MRD46751.1 glycolate oxidase subunit GlcF [Caenimonas koreensis DSM 17982]